MKNDLKKFKSKTPEKLPVLVDIHGSCVSRGCFNYDSDNLFKVNNYIFRNNLVSCLMDPIPFDIGRNELHAEFNYRSLNFSLKKNVLSLLEKSESSFLIIDLFDFCQPIATYKNTTFSVLDGLFFETKAYEQHKDEITLISIIDLPTYLWYTYVEIYFRKMIKFYGSNNIILIRTKCCNNFIDATGDVKEISKDKLSFGNSIYNDKLSKLENFIIDKFNPYVIDMSKYFISDYNHNSDVTPVHYEKDYYIETINLVKYIILNQPAKKIFDQLSNKAVLNRLSNPTPKNNFCNYWNNIEFPLKNFKLLDSLLFKFNVEDISDYRNEIYLLYQTIFEKLYENSFDSITITNDQKKSILIKSLKSFEIINEKHKSLIYFILFMLDEDTTEVFQYLENITKYNESITNQVINKLKEIIKDNVILNKLLITAESYAKYINFIKLILINNNFKALTILNDIIAQDDNEKISIIKTKIELLTFLKNNDFNANNEKMLRIANFELALMTNNINWIDMLSDLEKDYSHDSDVLWYKINYFIAINDMSSANEYISKTIELYPNMRIKIQKLLI